MSELEKLMVNPFVILFEKLERIEKMLVEYSETSQQTIIEKSADEKMNTKQLAEYLNCNRITIHNLKKQGTIPYYGTRKMTYFIKSEIDEALSSRKKKYK